MVSQSCDVRFSVFVPNLGEQNSNLILFTSHGKHAHVPPPPSKVPEDIIQDLHQVVEQARAPDITLGLFKHPMNRFESNLALARFQYSWALKQYLTGKGVSHVTELHPSLSNMDKIGLIIQKQKALWYPEGKSIAGLFLRYRIESTEVEEVWKRI